MDEFGIEVGSISSFCYDAENSLTTPSMDELETKSYKTFDVNRSFGRYEIRGSITFIPAPGPGFETALAFRIIDAEVVNVIRKKILTEMFN